MTNLHTDHQAIFESFLSARRAKHLDFRMDATGDPAPEGDPKPEDPPAEGDPKPEDKRTAEEKALDELPDWARKEIKKVRGEAANYRTQLREAQDALSKAKTPEEYAAALAEVNSKAEGLEKQLLVQKVAARHGLPEALANRLQGGDEAALEADAKALAALVVTGTTSPESLSGGLTPGESDDSFDPVEEARKARAGRRY